MSEVNTVGLDWAKQVFQVQAVDAGGAVVARVAPRRRRVLAWFARQPRCVVGEDA